MQTTMANRTGLYWHATMALRRSSMLSPSKGTLQTMSNCTNYVVSKSELCQICLLQHAYNATHL